MLYPSSWDKVNTTNNITAVTQLLEQASQNSYVALQAMDSLNPTSNLIWASCRLLSYCLSILLSFHVLWFSILLPKFAKI